MLFRRRRTAIVLRDLTPAELAEQAAYCVGQQIEWEFTPGEWRSGTVVSYRPDINCYVVDSPRVGTKIFVNAWIVQKAVDSTLCPACREPLDDGRHSVRYLQSMPMRAITCPKDPDTPHMQNNPAGRRFGIG